MKTLSALLFLALIALASSTQAQEVTDIGSSFEGVWAVEVTETSSTVEFHDVPESTINLVANFTKQAGHLMGTFASSDGLIDIQIQVVVEGPSAGSFYLLGGSSSDDEFDAGRSLLHFDLKNNTVRTHVGSGVWSGIGKEESAGAFGKPGFYQITYTDRNLFVLNVWSQDGTSLATVTASKVAVEPEQGWLSKFGTPLMFLGAMAFSRVLKSFVGPKEEQAGRPAAAGGAAPKAKAD